MPAKRSAIDAFGLASMPERSASMALHLAVMAMRSATMANLSGTDAFALVEQAVSVTARKALEEAKVVGEELAPYDDGVGYVERCEEARRQS